MTVLDATDQRETMQEMEDKYNLFFSEVEDEEEEDGDDRGCWAGLASGWKQHAVAIFIALIATVFFHGSFNASSLSNGFAMKVFFPFPGSKHLHIHSFQRTSGIHFCPNIKFEPDEFEHSNTITGGGTTRSPMSANKKLQIMSFRVPKHLTRVLHRHYWADLLEDDDYSSTLPMNHNRLVKEQPEYACLVDLEKETSQSFIEGISYAYIQPSFEEMYQQKPPTSAEASLSFTGFAAKFINLSSKPILLHWDGRGGTDDSARLVSEIRPFQAVGTATTPGQSFYVSPVYDYSHAMERWTVTADDALLVHHPLLHDTAAIDRLSPEQTNMYEMQLLNLEYSKDYLIKTRRTWLATFPRPYGMHHIHKADYFEQIQTIRTAHSHFLADDDQQQQDRVHSRPLELKLKTVSVAPKVFVIDGFLSKFECQHLVLLAKEQGLDPSTVLGSSSENANARRDARTRSSTNAWLPRESSEITNSIYKRAADLLKIDESLLRHRSEDHMKLATHNSIVESLQLVRYEKNQEYTPHHDFMYPKVANRYQPTRFATLLIYLNDNFEGGETVFPRAINANDHEGVTIKPKAGSAVLFYNMLPDGNADDISQHGGNQVTIGTKWVANMWVWDPVIS